MSVDILMLVARFGDYYGYNSTTKRAFAELLEELREGSKSDYLGTLYRTDFTVVGVGPFPIDMLRYCNAWPHDEEDARIISELCSFNEQLSTTQSSMVRLTKYHRDPSPVLSEERWESKFRWKIYRGHEDHKRIETVEQ